MDNIEPTTPPQSPRPIAVRFDDAPESREEYHDLDVVKAEIERQQQIVERYNQILQTPASELPDVVDEIIYDHPIEAENVLTSEVEEPLEPVFEQAIITDEITQPEVAEQEDEFAKITVRFENEPDVEAPEADQSPIVLTEQASSVAEVSETITDVETTSSEVVYSEAKTEDLAESADDLSEVSYIETPISVVAAEIDAEEIEQRAGGVETTEIPARIQTAEKSDIVHNLHQFEEFIGALAHPEETAEQATAVVEHVERINELTVMLQEAEVLADHKKVEIYTEELTQAFIELFTLTEHHFGENDVRAIVGLWIDKDVLTHEALKQDEEVVLLDDGMEEILLNFHIAMTTLKQYLEIAHEKLGRLVVATLHGRELAYQTA